MKVKAQQLIDAGACDSVHEYFERINRKQWDVEKLFNYAIKKKEYSDLSYGLSYLMDDYKRRKWAIYCAESCLHIFEKEYPEDDRPRKAIEAAKEYLNNPTDENDAARAAARAAAGAAAGAAGAAAWAAGAAAWAAGAAAWAAARAAARAAAGAAAYEDMLKKGLDILLDRG